eukprot:4571867-Karenia_brevis.AAC.1
MHETVVLTVVRREPYPPSGDGNLQQWHNCEILLVDPVCWDYTMFHQFHTYGELRIGMYVDQRKITLRGMRQWLGK